LLFVSRLIHNYYIHSIDNTDPTNLDSLQALRNQLAAKYLKTRLDAYSLYVYEVLISKLKLNDEAINILVESVKKKPTLWCAWLELTNLIKWFAIIKLILLLLFVNNLVINIYMNLFKAKYMCLCCHIIG